ncbi:HPr family phosphocarrier protein [Colwellia sp. 4_MG-2023]|jgi:phosphocarrier protein NPr|uniref:HPr family phosphocarrier protein n=1 Tax=unclassified Colwellia TaxID=196834 RepID=UPI001C09C7DE|nr:MULTISPECIES: HPr family phosphocarrier protein [unclassified Colwellia]MBU2925008.1 HPr family phosphocarrier protein [Colwellia sp. C2M11]MDO6486413.1 HPr family phosphocarrier protein [Colwellia sp. 6_MG-2023]MDO6506291.1 HPr family phosphocarrier protein [Colwellia sp. 5_MG-2023]MDO6557371.1 HPr family phosphocarrier protein [Colwellia sp. 4_MG-2023]MDO6651699.1 HPr family phosphocarrier protein [Colwellia sp. 3_MG-2023]
MSIQKHNKNHDDIIVSKELTIINKLGLHARAASKLALLCQKFSAQITLSLEEKEADANSIMAIMLLAGGQGKNVTVTAQGTDAPAALEAISQLIEAKFDEDE